MRAALRKGKAKATTIQLALVFSAVKRTLTFVSRLTTMMRQSARAH